MMKVTKTPSERDQTGVFIGTQTGIYFPVASDPGKYAFVDRDGKAHIINLPNTRQIPVRVGEAVSLQF